MFATMSCLSTSTSINTAQSTSEGVEMNKIADAIKRAQTEGGDGNAIVVIADTKKNYYIQFAMMRGKAEIYAEAVSNKYLKPENALSDEQLSKLEALGWQRNEGQNYYRNWTANNDEDREAISQDVMRAFIEVYGLPVNVEVKIELILE